MKESEVIDLVKVSGLPADAQSVIVRSYNKMVEMQEDAGCLYISVALCIALEYLGYKPRLCIGKVWAGGFDYYHAWVELDGKVIDAAIYGNSAYSPHWSGGIIMPQIYKDYVETDVRYDHFAFDEDFEYSGIHQSAGRTYYAYCDALPQNALWNLILYYVASTTPDTLNAVKEIAKKHTIGERESKDD